MPCRVAIARGSLEAQAKRVNSDLARNQLLVSRKKQAVHRDKVGKEIEDLVHIIIAGRIARGKRDLDGCLGFGGRGTAKKAFRAEILVQVRPVNSVSCSCQFPIASLLRSRMEKLRVPS